MTFLSDPENEDTHHSDTKSAHKLFQKDLGNLYSVFQDFGNPFMEESEEFFNIETKRVFSPEVVETVRSIERMGNEQYRAYVTERIKSSQLSIHDRIAQNKLFLCSSSPKNNALAKKDVQIKVLKEDCQLFNRLFAAVSSSNREHDIEMFFKHETHIFPPSLCHNGILRSTSKSELYKRLLDCIGETPVSQPPVQVKIIEGAAIIHMLKPRTARDFKEYIENVYIPFIVRECTNVERLDVVWDRYVKIACNFCLV